MVTALLVSHSGARWLPAVLDSLAAQSRAVDRCIAVTTGGTDHSRELLDASPQVELTVDAPPATGFGEAVRRGLDAAPALDPDEWIWLLHDDSSADAAALERLLAAADLEPAAEVLGPKLREWPSLRRLLEVGVTISGTGRRETGLERGEYDQGQHDEVRQVLAVNTAGMLVRRRVLTELDSFDDELPIFGNDLDFGWRAARAGHRTLVVPSAVMFHAEAAHRGLRKTELTGQHTHYQERRAALWTLLANTESPRLPWLAVRLLVGSLLRAVGLLLVRAGRSAGDEVAALVAVYGQPRRLRAARLARREQATVPARAVRGLLAPWWVPYRHGLDAVTDFVDALTSQAHDVAQRRRAAAVAADLADDGAAHRGGRRSAGPQTREDSDADDEVLAADNGWLVSLLTQPVALGLLVFGIVVAVATRDAWGGVSGGALPPAPASSGDWWQLHVRSWHPLEMGTDVPSPAYVPLLAGLGALLGGSAQAAMTALMLLAFPAALWGAWRLLRVAGHLATPQGAPRWLLGWGAMVYALVPATSGAWGEGRYGLVVAAALLPWLAHASLGLIDPDVDRRWRAAWRSAILLAVLTAFAPLAWPFAAVLTVTALAVIAARRGSLTLNRSVIGPPVVSLVAAAVLLLGWWLPLLTTGHPGGLLLEPGRPSDDAPAGLDLALGRAGELAAPVWLGLSLALLAVAALIPGASRKPVLVCWLIALVAAIMALVLSFVALPVGGGSVRPDLSLIAALLPGLAVVAVMIAGTRAARDLVRGALPRVAGAAGLVLLIVPVAGLVWFTALAENELAPTGDQGIPAYMKQSAQLGPQHGLVTMQGDLDSGLTYTVWRGDGPTVGEPEIISLTAPDDELTNVLGELVSRPRPVQAQALAERGIEYVVLSSPADPEVAALLDTAPGLAQAGAEDRTMRAWQVSPPLSAASLAAPDSSSRTLLVGIQIVALLVAVVLCAPSRREQR